MLMVNVGSPLQVFFYSNLIFEKAGFEEADSQDLASVALGVLNVVMTIISVSLVTLFCSVVQRSGWNA